MNFNHAGYFEIPLQLLFFMTQAGKFGTVYCNGKFSSNVHTMMHTFKNPQNRIRAQMVVKLTNKLQLAEIETDSYI